MKLGMKGNAGPGALRTLGTFVNPQVKAPRQLSTATSMSTPKPGKNSLAGMLRGSMTEGKSGGVIITK